jgi:hypothetical protein
MRRRSLLVASRFILLATASVLLYFGLGMLLLVPGDPGGPYWAKERVVYGAVPFVSGLVAPAISTWIATFDGSHAGPGLAINDSCVHVQIRIP